MTSREVRSAESGRQPEIGDSLRHRGISSSLGRANQFGRVVWSVVYWWAFRPSPRVLNVWRRLVLRCFGASVGRGVAVHPSVRSWAPWHLTMGDYSAIGYQVDCYNVSPILLGKRSIVSQYSFLCTATHDFERALLPLVHSPIIVGDDAWVCADVFVAPGVTVGAGAVIGARSSVYRSVEPWTVVAGNPARFLRRRGVQANSAGPGT
jgi:putative colanic acid biosynthesis acetyltransferase WcaF